MVAAGRGWRTGEVKMGWRPFVDAFRCQREEGRSRERGARAPTWEALEQAGLVERPVAELYVAAAPRKGCRPVCC